MKLRPIKSERELVGGQLYIRACVNYHGKHWVEVFYVNGTPFNKYNRSEMAKQPSYIKDINRSVHIKRTGRFSNQDTRFMGDLGLRNREGTRLYRFSNKALKWLNSLELRDFCQVNAGKRLTDEEWSDLELRWKFNDHIDDMMHKERMRASEEEYQRKFMTRQGVTT